MCSRLINNYLIMIVRRRVALAGAGPVLFEPFFRLVATGTVFDDFVDQAKLPGFEWGQEFVALEAIQTALERDKFLSPLEAREFGLIDEVVDNRPGRDEPEKGFK